jgi:hypothetical protein
MRLYLSLLLSFTLTLCSFPVSAQGLSAASTPSRDGA